jgi:hypothetical protein
VFDPGHCTTLRWNLHDTLRMSHLEQAVRKSIDDRVEAETALCQ